MLKYIEIKSGFRENGPAWIARVVAAKTGQTLYLNGKALKRTKGVAEGNYFDSVTGEEYWVSGVKRRGSNRHEAGSGRIRVEAAALQELLEWRGEAALDTSLFTIVHGLVPADPAAFVAQENAPLRRS